MWSVSAHRIVLRLIFQKFIKVQNMVSTLCRQCRPRRGHTLVAAVAPKRPQRFQKPLRSNILPMFDLSEVVVGHLGVATATKVRPFLRVEIPMKFIS
ncbi:MAG: hypothetical protein CSB02_01105 [Bacteroidia bacterium]|nr:MAG: hypothetical protein CSB02_01105 [Bacteroidia bacterium]